MRGMIVHAEDLIRGPTDVEVTLRASPPVKSESFIKKAARFLEVATGRLVTEAVFDSRLRSCSGCPVIRASGDNRYCGACGCAQWRLAELGKKLWFANLECPLGRFGRVTSEADLASRREVRRVKTRRARDKPKGEKRQFGEGPSTRL